MSTKYLGHAGFRQESAFGEEASPPEIFEEILSESIMMQNNFIRPNVVDGTRYRSYAAPGPISAGGGIGMQLRPEGSTPWLMKGLFGQVSSQEADAGVYNHVFSPAQTHYLPSFSIQVNVEDTSQTWLGCTFTSATLSVVKTQLASLNLNLLSQRPGESSQQADPVFSEILPWPGYGFSFTLNGESNVKFEDFTITFRNDIEAVHTLNGKRYCRKHYAKGFDLEGRITLQFETEAERRRLWGALSATGPRNTVEPGSISVTATHEAEIAPGHKYSLTIDVPEIYYESAPANIKQAKDRILQTISFFPTCSRAVSKLVDLTLRNSQSGYPGPA